MTFLAVGVALLLVAAAWRVRRYSRALRIAARRDDGFVFGKPLGEHPVSLQADGFDLPAQPGAAHTALLTLRVKSTLPGHWQEPFIDMQIDGRSSRQYFERGARGRRYLNLSGVLPDSAARAARVKLSASGLRWEATATLTTFAAPPLAGGPLLVLAPHPDDSEIAAFGLYAGSSACIVTLTAGECSPTDLSAAGVDKQTQSQWLARLRTWDSLHIPRLGDIPPDLCLNLAYPDTRLRAMRDNPEQDFMLVCEPECTRASLRALNSSPRFRRADAACRWTELVRELRTLLDELRPAAIVCPHPWLDAHPDHGAATTALAEALRASSHRPATFLLYTVHVRNASLFPFGESSGCCSLPPGSFSAPVADSIYSHPLPEALRLRKRFAVEAAHDLRNYQHDGRTPAKTLLRLALRPLAALISGMPLAPANYMRRGARPNEIYYVVDEAGLMRLTSESRS